jgi:hypothetical protein
MAVETRLIKTANPEMIIFMESNFDLQNEIICKVKRCCATKKIPTGKFALFYHLCQRPENAPERMPMLQAFLSKT